jgi:hypothetical protein
MQSWNEIRSHLGQRMTIVKDEDSWLGLAASTPDGVFYLVIKLGQALDQPCVIVAVAVCRAEDIPPAAALAYNGVSQRGALVFNGGACHLRHLFALTDITLEALDQTVDHMLAETTRLRQALGKRSHDSPFAHFAE